MISFLELCNQTYTKGQPSFCGISDKAITGLLLALGMSSLNHIVCRIQEVSWKWSYFLEEEYLKQCSNPSWRKKKKKKGFKMLNSILVLNATISQAEEYLLWDYFSFFFLSMHHSWNNGFQSVHCLFNSDKYTWKMLY